MKRREFLKAVLSGTAAALLGVAPRQVSGPVPWRLKVMGYTWEMVGDDRVRCVSVGRHATTIVVDDSPDQVLVAEEVSDMWVVRHG